MYRIKVEFELESKDFEDFFKNLNPYINQINLNKIKETYSDNCKKAKQVILKEDIRENKLIELLQLKKELSTSKLYFLFKRNYYPFSRKTFSRFLIKESMKSIIKVRKQKKKNGGYENMWSLKWIM